MDNLIGDDLEHLPTDSNEPLAHMDVGTIQKMLKKAPKKQVVQTVDVNASHIRSHLVRDMKTVLLATLLYLVLGHPKLDAILSSFTKDVIILYTIKGTMFAVLLFVLIHKVC